MDIGEYTLELLSYSVNYNQWLFRKIEPYLEGKVLEIGGGIGTFTRMLLGRAQKVTVLDINKKYLEKLKKKFPGKNLEIVYADIQKKIPLREKFDAAICFNVLEHLGDDMMAITRISGTLKKGGLLLLLVPAHQVLFGSLDKNLGHKRRYNKRQISFLLENAGFRIRKIRHLNMLGAFGWLINSKILKRETLPRKQLFIFEKISLPLLFLEDLFFTPFGLSIFVIGEKK